MATQLIDESEAEETLTPEQLQEALKEETTEVPETTEEVPEKYKGKSLKEVIAMHQEAEKVLGRQGSEVGELRHIVDSFIQGQTKKSETPPAPAPDYFEDPQGAVSHAIEHHPSVVAAREAAATLTRQQAAAAIRHAHPDAAEVVKSPEFAEFIKASPIRTELFVRADTQFDFAAADELLTSFKERKRAVQTTATAEEQVRRQALRQASTGSARGSAESGDGKRIYRRADIIRLMRDDPLRYDQLSDEITQAYQEGRVR